MVGTGEMVGRGVGWAGRVGAIGMQDTDSIRIEKVNTRLRLIETPKTPNDSQLINRCHLLFSASQVNDNSTVYGDISLYNISRGNAQIPNPPKCGGQANWDT